MGRWAGSIEGLRRAQPLAQTGRAWGAEAAATAALQSASTAGSAQMGMVGRADGLGSKPAGGFNEIGRTSTGTAWTGWRRSLTGIGSGAAAIGRPIGDGWGRPRDAAVRIEIINGKFRSRMCICMPSRNGGGIESTATDRAGSAGRGPGMDASAVGEASARGVPDGRNGFGQDR